MSTVEVWTVKWKGKKTKKIWICEAFDGLWSKLYPQKYVAILVIWPYNKCAQSSRWHFERYFQEIDYTDILHLPRLRKEIIIIIIISSSVRPFTLLIVAWYYQEPPLIVSPAKFYEQIISNWNFRYSFLSEFLNGIRKRRMDGRETFILNCMKLPILKSSW